MKLSAVECFRVLSSAWSLDVQQQKKRKCYSETEFLPAALEVIETPASPIGRIGLWTLMLGVMITIIWALVGKLDVVVVAPGRIIPADRVKIIQPTELAVIKSLPVQDGQMVKAGELLIELDATTAGAEDAQALLGLQAAQVDRARSQAVLSYLSGAAAKFTPPPGTLSEDSQVQQRLLAAQIEEFRARHAILRQQQLEHQAELDAAQAERAKLEETLPLFDVQIEGRRQLVAAGYFPRLRLHELEEQRIERVRNMDVQRSAAAKARAGIARVQGQIKQLQSELERLTAKELIDAENNKRLRENEIAKTALRNHQMRLTSPVDGIVQQLSVHTVGGVVQPAQPLMIVVPSDGKLVIDAKVSNKDIGLLRNGQFVRIKIDAFPFSDYGTVDGILKDISRDAIEDEKLGLVYNARVEIQRSPRSTKRSEIVLSPGMTVTAEIKTSRRRIIDYLLSPLSNRIDEAARER
ncbi:hemolysin D [Sphingobium sp. B2D3A]|uniref:HlyD family type I secretion periplasmic adaptor subunit n=1 Tax=unclassified Sphingobium TaxID=2611147 RepID=UPI002225321B|nr:MULTISPECIES: HlyD family type I secretion periplasmic adaptor subunit [unclassified Sphingobium]MCW2339105.1 hemolysin D [Sphingobium sp. B2D3A]MCW2386952.1 hemolysin D [Sphingobium sp. B2D3D]